MSKDRVDDGDEFEVPYGYRFLVTGVAQTVFKGSYRMKIWIVPGAPVIHHVPEPKKTDLELIAEAIKKR